MIKEECGEEPRLDGIHDCVNLHLLLAYVSSCVQLFLILRQLLVADSEQMVE